MDLQDERVAFRFKNVWFKNMSTKKEFELDKIPTKFNVSNILTKAVGSDAMDGQALGKGRFGISSCAEREAIQSAQAQRNLS